MYSFRKWLHTLGLALFSIFAVFAYSILWGILFSELEHPSERQKNADLRELVALLQEVCHKKEFCERACPFSNSTNMPCDPKSLLPMATNRICDILDERVSLQTSDVWNYWHATLFVLSTISTIGYGRSAPVNSLSRALCIVCAIGGIPLAAFCLATIANLILIPMKGMWLRFSPTYTPTHGRIHIFRALVRSYAGPVVLGSVVIILIFGVFTPTFAALFVACETWSFLEAYYFSFISLSTIGFGDFTPTNATSATITMVMVFMGSGLVFALWSVFIDCCHSARWRRARALAEGRGDIGLQHVDEYERRRSPWGWGSVWARDLHRRGDPNGGSPLDGLPAVTSTNGTKDHYQQAANHRGARWWDGLLGGWGRGGGYDGEPPVGRVGAEWDEGGDGGGAASGAGGGCPQGHERRLNPLHPNEGPAGEWEAWDTVRAPRTPHPQWGGYRHGGVHGGQRGGAMGGRGQQAMWAIGVGGYGGPGGWNSVGGHGSGRGGRGTYGGPYVDADGYYRGGGCVGSRSGGGYYSPAGGGPPAACGYTYPCTGVHPAGGAAAGWQPPDISPPTIGYSGPFPHGAVPHLAGGRGPGPPQGGGGAVAPSAARPVPPHTPPFKWSPAGAARIMSTPSAGIVLGAAQLGWTPFGGPPPPTPCVQPRGCGGCGAAGPSSPAVPAPRIGPYSPNFIAANSPSTSASPDAPACDQAVTPTCSLLPPLPTPCVAPFTALDHRVLTPSSPHSR